MKKKWFGIKKKLDARFVGPYKIIEKKGLMAYKLQLPEAMGSIFLVFLVSQLKKCVCSGREDRTSGHPDQIRFRIP
jgi:hypothetical protein